MLDKISDSKFIYWLQHSWGFSLIIVPCFASLIAGLVLLCLGNNWGVVLFVAPIIFALLVNLFFKDVSNERTEEQKLDDKIREHAKEIQVQLKFKELFVGKVDLAYIIINSIVNYILVGATIGILEWPKWAYVIGLCLVGAEVWVRARIKYEKILLAKKEICGNSEGK